MLASYYDNGRAGCDDERPCASHDGQRAYCDDGRICPCCDDEKACCDDERTCHVPSHNGTSSSCVIMMHHMLCRHDASHALCDEAYCDEACTKLGVAPRRLRGSRAHTQCLSWRQHCKKLASAKASSRRLLMPMRGWWTCRPLCPIVGLSAAGCPLASFSSSLSLTGQGSSASS